MAPVGYSGALRILIHETNLKRKILCQTPFKGILAQDFQLMAFFSGFPKDPECTLGAISNFYEKFANIFECRGKPLVSAAGDKCQNLLRQKIFLYFVQKLLDCIIRLQNKFFQNLYSKVQADLYLSNNFIAGVVDTGNKLIAGIVVLDKKLSPESLYWQLIIASVIELTKIMKQRHRQ